MAENPGLTVSATPLRSIISDKRSISWNIPISLSFNSLSIEASGSSSVTTYNNAASDASTGITPAHHLDPAQQAKMAAVLTKAGIMSPMAWAAAGIDSAAQATSHTAANGTAAAVAPAPEQFDLHPPAVLMKGKHNPAFFISWRSQREVVKSLGWKSALMIWGGPALTLLCVYILASQYGGL
jgi:hypothetical protein